MEISKYFNLINPDSYTFLPTWKITEIYSRFRLASKGGDTRDYMATGYDQFWPIFISLFYHVHWKFTDVS